MTGTKLPIQFSNLGLPDGDVGTRNRNQNLTTTEATYTIDPNRANRINLVSNSGLLDGNVRIRNQNRNRASNPDNQSKSCQVPIESIRSSIRVCNMAMSESETKIETEATHTINPNRAKCQSNQSGLQFGFTGWQRPNQKQKQPTQSIQIDPSANRINPVSNLGFLLDGNVQIRNQSRNRSNPHN